MDRVIGNWKPERGSGVLAKEARRAEIEAHERAVKQRTKRRDGGCRWPEASDCRGILEGAHIEAKGMGGDHGERTHTGNVVTLCLWHHRKGPASIHSPNGRIDCETDAGADGPLSFWRRGSDGGWFCVGRERSVGVIERD